MIKIIGYTVTKEDLDSLGPNQEPCNTLYPLSNEILYLYSTFDFTNTLTTATDHFFYALLNGAENITIYDMNGMTKLWLEFKIAAISALSFEEFWELFAYILPESKIYYNDERLEELLNKIKASLKETISEEEFEVFEEWMKEFKTKEDFKKFFSLYFDFRNSIFTEAANYKILKERINNEDLEVTYLNTNITNLSTRLSEINSGKFTTIITSNITDYVDKDTFTTEVIMPLKEYLEDNGIIQIEYIYLYTTNSRFINNTKIKTNADTQGHDEYLVGPYIVYLTKEDIEEITQ